MVAGKKCISNSGKLIVKMKTFGLIGKNLSHSFSPGYFQKKFVSQGIDAQYLLFEFSELTLLRNLVKNNQELSGLNVTIPFKKEVIPYLDELDEVASAISAVNTICVLRNGESIILKGFNTDVTGFERTVVQFLKNTTGISALVLGTGGSAASVSYVLHKLDIPFLSVSRNPKNKMELGYNQLRKNIIQNNRLIINTTPLGMYPDISVFPPIPYQFLGESHYLYDLIYNPAETEFLKRGRQQGAKTINGMNMLLMQAEESWKIWMTF